MKAVGYIRVSTEDQVSGHSLLNQEERIRAYCSYKNYQLTQIIRDEGISGGKNREREGFNLLLDLMECGDFHILVLYSLERLSRDMFTLLSLERLCNIYEISLHTIEGGFDTSTPTGFMQFAMLSLMAEIERRTVIYRTKKIMESNKRKGKVVGSIPYGFKRDGDSLVEVPEEQRVIEKVNFLYKSGRKLCEILLSIKEQSILARNGLPFSVQQIKRMIQGYENKFSKGRTRERDLAKQMKAILLSN